MISYLLAHNKSISMDSTGLNSNKFNNLLQYKTVPLNRMKFLIFVLVLIGLSPMTMPPWI